MSAPLLAVERLSKHFAVARGAFGLRKALVRAVTEVSFTVRPGEVVGLVGESGSGKSTLGRAILRLVEPSAGRVRFNGEDVTAAPPAALRRLRREMQIVFQDPYGSLDPRKRVERLIGEAFAIHKLDDGGDRRARIVEILEEVGLAAEHLRRYPHEFSGGQRQRIGIARALAVRPSFIVADEPVSALDVSVQAQIINLLADLQARRNLALLFISHDLSVVEYVSDRVLVMYLGRLVETAPARELYANPKHPYSEALLSAAPTPDPGAPRRRVVLQGDQPSPLHPPSGCAFRTRCRYALPACAAAVPPLREVAPGHHKACIRDDVL